MEHSSRSLDPSGPTGRVAGSAAEHAPEVEPSTSAGRDAPRLLTVGRINLDLFAEPTARGLVDALSFQPSVGGSPTNTAIAARRLGVPTALLSAVGDDQVGDLVEARLAATGVETTWVGRVSGRRTSMAFLATISPDTGDRVFYRHEAADTFVDPHVVETLPWGTVEVIVLSADSLASGSTPEAVARVARSARERGTAVWWDLDLRPSSWPQPADYGRTALPCLTGADLVIGTEEEFTALLAGGADLAGGELLERVRSLDATVKVLKRGPRGATLIRADQDDLDVAALATQAVCTVGAGDSMTGALVAARLRGDAWPEAMRFAMRAAAHTVMRPGCSEGFPALEDLQVAP